MLTAFLAFYAFMFVLIDFHFLYRLWAIRWLVAIASSVCIAWLVDSYLVGCVFRSFRYLVTENLFYATEHGRLIIANATYEKFGLDSMRMVMIMGDYFLEDGSRNDETVVAVAIYCVILATCFGFMIYSIFDIVSCLQSTTQIASKKTQSMQKQFFAALCAQSLIPFFLLHCPCGIIIVFPFFRLNATIVADITPFLLSAFLPLDALVVLYIMKDYRKAVFQLFSCG
ncbi:hypothetical protein PMAYCL1PPCAC_14923, partial [Pristionchus mayeri]